MNIKYTPVSELKYKIGDVVWCKTFPFITPFKAKIIDIPSNNDKFFLSVCPIDQNGEYINSFEYYLIDQCDCYYEYF